MAAHHATLLLQPFLITAVIISNINKQNWRSLVSRSILYCLLAIIVSIMVIWPFWKWGLGQTMQTPIDHQSRHNFFTDPSAQLFFFWPLYGPLVIVIPFVFYKWNNKFRGLILAFLGLFLLGLGGTTLLPHLIFGSNWEWLTYDRFAFWAALFLTPLFGSILILVRRRIRFSTSLHSRSLLRTRILTHAFFIFAGTSLGSWTIQYFLPTQPAPIDMKPVLEYLNQNDRSQWRYLTFGFGQQFAYLNLLTKATTIDGSYHTARSLPVLRNSGIAEIDTALWTIRGVPAIDPVLKIAGLYGVRWGFVNRWEYEPELEMNGWLYRTTLKDGIDVWENPNSILPQASRPPSQDPLTSISWGLLPLLSLTISSVLGLLSFKGLSLKTN
jgi:hypothetical protein